MSKPSWDRDFKHALSCLSDARRAIENLAEATDGYIPIENTIDSAARTLDGTRALLREADDRFKKDVRP